VQELADIHDLVALYALGALDGDERTRFEVHLASCGHCRAELPSLEGTAAALALDVDGIEPRPGLRARILETARDERAQPAPARRLRRRWALPTAATLAVGASCAAIGVGIWAVRLSNDVGRERVDTRALSIVADPNATRFPLIGAEGSVVITPRREAALVVSGLARAPRGKTYELWVLVAEQPRPAGTFGGGGKRSLVALTRKVPRGSRVSVSLEPAGGSSTLTGDLLFGAETA
jgi:anti-sigma-K factor RskA